MLLNLFLAILLKALSKEPNEEQPEGEGEAPAPAPAAAEEEGKQKEADKVSVHITVQEPSAALDSSNSNIEAEFEIIKRELEKISRGLHLNQDGTVNLNQSLEDNGQAKEEEDEDLVISEMSSQSLDSESARGRRQSKEKKKEKEKEAKTKKEAAKQAKIQSVFASDQAKGDDEEAWKKEKSLYLFSHDNKLRVALNHFLGNSFFSGFIYHMIALNSLLLILDSPELADTY